MNQYFTNDDYLMFVFGDGEKPETKPLYSRYEEYALYKGLDRTNNKVADYNYFSKIYIRADLKKTVITRKYQKFMEFYADASSLLIALYEILVVIFNYVDTFYAHHSLSKTIFFFKELKDEDNFNILKKNKKIEELLYMIDSNSSKRNSMQMDSKASSMNKFYTPSSKDSKHVRVMDKEEDEVALLEGSVEVRMQGQQGSVTLAPGELLKYDKQSGSVERRRFAANYYEEVLQAGGLQFNNEKLCDIAAVLTRNFGVKIIIEDPSLSAERYFASFINGEGVDAILSALNTGNHFQINRKNNIIYITR